MVKQAIKLHNLIQVLNEWYPNELAEEWDQNGIHFGTPEASINRVLVTLDIRPNVVAEAISKNIDTIIVHHPPLFKPIQRFDMRHQDVQMYAQLIKHDINVFAMHTNFDAAHNGMNDWLANKLGLTQIESLVSPENTDTVNTPSIGRVGQWETALTRDEVIALIKHQFNRSVLTVIEQEPKKTYQKVGIVGGAGSSFMQAAIQQQVDLFITGDISYHQGHDFYDANFMTIDAGHYIESIFVPGLTESIQQLVEERQWDIKVIASQEDTNPFTFL